MCFLYKTLDKNFTMAKYLNTTLQSNRKAITQLRLLTTNLWLNEEGGWTYYMMIELVYTVMYWKMNISQLLCVQSIRLLENNNKIILRWDAVNVQVYPVTENW